jgi:rod shape-determining protein MreC
MRNLLLFIRRFINLILFLALEVVCVVLISRTRTLQGSDILSSSNAVSGYFYTRQNNLTRYFSLGKVNDSLMKENARLQAQIAAIRYSTDTLRDSAVVRTIAPADSLHPVQYARYIYRTARVINNSVAEKNNYLTLNRGSKDGIKEGMAVISGSGIVGKVMHTSAHFATVLSVLSEVQQVSAHLKDGTTGLVRWDYEGRIRKPDVLFMPEVPMEIPLHLGDSVYTTAYSFFPPDVMVGTISGSQIIKRTGKRLLQLRPATNFRNVEYVYVVENTMAPEQRAVEALNTVKKEERKK